MIVFIDVVQDTRSAGCHCNDINMNVSFSNWIPLDSNKNAMDRNRSILRYPHATDGPTCITFPAFTSSEATVAPEYEISSKAVFKT